MVIALSGHGIEEQRERIRQLGCRWDPRRRLWVVARVGMRMEEDRPCYQAVRRAIERGELTGVRLALFR